MTLHEPCIGHVNASRSQYIFSLCLFEQIELKSPVFLEGRFNHCLIECSGGLKCLKLYHQSYLSALGIAWSGIASISDGGHRRMHCRSHLSLRCQSIGNTPCHDIPVSVHHHTRLINIHPFSIFTSKLGITLHSVGLLLCIVTGIFHGDFLSIGLGIPVHLILKQLKKISNLANQH